MAMAMPRSEAMQVHGTVVESLPNATFHVTLDNGIACSRTRWARCARST